MKLTNRKMQEIVKFIYLLFLSAVVPAYMNQGYYMLGEAKGVTFLIGGSALLVLYTLIKLLDHSKKLFNSAYHKSIFGFFFFSNVITFIFSIDKKTAFLGLEGWRTGLLAVIIMASFAVFFSNGFSLHKVGTAILLLFPFISFVLGILNRFDIYPIDIYGKNSSFLATLGNINWYTGFLSVAVSVGIGLSFGKKLFSLDGILTNLYVVAGLVALLLQGSESGALVLFGAYGIMLFMAFGKREKFRNFLFQAGVLGFAMAVTEILLVFFGGRYNYEDNILITVCHMHVGIILMAVAFFIYRVSRLFEEIKVPFVGKICRKVMVILAAALVLAVVVIFVLYFDGSFGNGRGIIWQISMDMFAGLSSWQKLFGVGQDCYFTYAYNHPFWAESLLNMLNGNRLTNAHCEVMTILIERGMVGVAAYVALVLGALHSAIKAFENSEDSKKEHAAIICALPITAYLFNCLVSFETVTSTTFVFALIGIAYSLNQAQE